MRGSDADLNQAMVFCKIVECEGFSAAAAALGMPRATVSKKLQDLEARLGTLLIHRTTRRLSLTEAGVSFHQHCHAALAQLGAAEDAVRALQQEPRGMLRVGAPTTIGLAELMPMLTRFMEKYPDVQATLLLVNEDLDREQAQLDVAIRLGTLPASGHSAHLVHQARVALFASPDYIARRGMPRAAMDLAHHDLIALTQMADGDRVRFSLSPASGVGGDGVTITAMARLMSNDASAMMAAALGGIGIAPLPLRYALAKVHGGDLVPVLPGWLLQPVDVFAIFGSRRGMSRKSSAFVDFMTAWFRELDEADGVPTDKTRRVA